MLASWASMGCGTNHTQRHTDTHSHTHTHAKTCVHAVSSRSRILPLKHRIVLGLAVSLIGGSCDSVSKVISTLIGVISINITIVALFIALLTQSNDPLSRASAPT